MRARLTIGAALTLALLSLARPAVAAPDEAEQLYKSYGDAIYQVQVVDQTTGKKTSIGSGFQVNAGGLIATNYHVVSEAVQRPDGNRVEFLHDKGEHGQLKILSADVVHDLAILQMEKPGKSFLTLGASNLPKGTKIFSLGNPHDIGFTIIEGTHSGLARDSFGKRIHFSGSLNPGMSGGPAIDRDGRVVGINVATAGNQISFLVPVEPLGQLIRQYRAGTSAGIEAQLLRHQDETIGALLKRKKWESVKLGPVMVPGRIHDALKCWGGVDSQDKDPFNYFVSVCGVEDRLFLDTGFDTGTLGYRYSYITPKEKLGLPRFYSLYENAFKPNEDDFDNVKEDDATNFSCESGFVSLAGFTWKSHLCLRQYKKYPAIFDLHLALAQVGEGEKGFTATLTAEGVSRDNALALARRFMHEIKPADKSGDAP